MGRQAPACDDGATMATTPPHATSPRRAYRSSTDSLIGGVASGVAVHLGLPVTWVRLGLMGLALLGGMGMVLYAALWVVLPSEERFDIGAPGTESATRQGRRPSSSNTRRSDGGFLITFGTIVIGVALLIGTITGSSGLVWPLALLSISVVVLWRQADAAQRERWLDASGGMSPMRMLVGSGGWASYARLVHGIGLLIAAIVLYAVRRGQINATPEVAVATVLGVLGVGFVLGPWLLRVSSDLSAERAERIRVQERADVAAHLHDSVLQTLALIQRSSDDPQTVARLARAQERDLRTWLYAGLPAENDDLGAALRAAAAEVEDAFGTPVEVVVVGQPAYAEPLVAAAREAMVNAAKHSGAQAIDVYAESDQTETAVFIRDRGRGFALGEVAADRRGISHSIKDRMERHGGRAEVRSAPGEGTEVRLYLTKESS